MKKITPCLWFDNNAEEAVDFYSSVFKDFRKKAVSHYGDHGPGPAGQVMTVEFEIFGQKFLALNGGPQFRFNESVSFVVNCDTQEEVDYYWEKLSEGGEKSMCGWVKDRFGLSWQVTPTKIGGWLTNSPERSARVMEAVMKMDKLVIATLEKAYNGA